MAKPRKQLVLVVWEDANVGGDDAVSLDNVDSFHKPTIVHTLGWVLKQDEAGVTVCNEFYDHTYRGRTFIIGKNILDVIPYNLSKTRKPRNASNASDQPSSSGDPEVCS